MDENEYYNKFCNECYVLLGRLVVARSQRDALLEAWGADINQMNNLIERLQGWLDSPSLDANSLVQLLIMDLRHWSGTLDAVDVDTR